MSCTPIPSGFTKGDRIDGITNKRGQKAGIEQNWGYYAKDEKYAGHEQYPEHDE